MAPPRLSDFDALHDRRAIDMLGDTIQYRPAGEAAFITIPAFGDFADRVWNIEGVDAIGQAVQVEVLKADVPVKPGPRVRIRLNIAGMTEREFMPVNVITTETGAHWGFDLKDVVRDA